MHLRSSLGQTYDAVEVVRDVRVQTSGEIERFANPMIVQTTKQ